MSEITGVELDGAEPRELVLSDGSRLTLRDDVGPAEWVRGSDRGEAGSLSLEAALAVAGDEYAEYVRIRTRSEAAWLRIVSEWFADQAERLEGDLRSVR